jgi:hypothetical protein
MDATNRAIDFAREQNQIGRGDIERYYGEGNKFTEDYRNAGKKALEAYLGGLGLDPNVSKESIYEKFRDSPGYQFALDEGNKAISRGAAARGITQSGATLKALSDYGQGMADQQYNGWLDRIASTMGMGAELSSQSAQNAWNTGNNLANLGNNLSTNVGNLYGGQGESAANSAMAGANARAYAKANQGGFWSGVGKVAGGLAGTFLGGPGGGALGAAAGGWLFGKGSK